MLGDRWAADEVAQVTFVRLFRALPRFRYEATLSTWLHRVTVNLCRDWLRRRKRERRLVPLTSLERDPVVAMSREAESGADEERLRLAVARLPPELALVVSLRYAGALSYADIAKTLGWPLGTVCTRLQRALKRLGGDLRQRSTETLR